MKVDIELENFNEAALRRNIEAMENYLKGKPRGCDWAPMMDSITVFRGLLESYFERPRRKMAATAEELARLSAARGGAR